MLKDVYMEEYILQGDPEKVIKESKEEYIFINRLKMTLKDIDKGLYMSFSDAMLRT